MTIVMCKTVVNYLHCRDYVRRASSRHIHADRQNGIAS